MAGRNPQTSWKPADKMSALPSIGTRRAAKRYAQVAEQMAVWGLPFAQMLNHVYRRDRDTAEDTARSLIVYHCCPEVADGNRV